MGIGESGGIGGPGGVSDHEALTGLLGGIIDEHFHLTDAEHGDLSGADLGSLIAGSILYKKADGLGQNNPQFFWDNVNNRLGIGTNAPLGSVHAFGDDAKLFIGRHSAGVGESSLELYFAGGSAEEAAINFNAGAGILASIKMLVGGGASLIFETAGSQRMRIQSGGNVGIGTPSPDQLLSVNGNASKAGGGSWAVFSDRRVKKVIGHYAKGLKELRQIFPVIFKYNHLTGHDEQKEHVGPIAQDMENILPGTVEKIKTKHFKDQRSFDSSEVLWLLVNSVKELEERVIELENGR